MAVDDIGRVALFGVQPPVKAGLGREKNMKLPLFLTNFLLLLFYTRPFQPCLPLLLYIAYVYT
jgi:hypothetical protein